MIVSGPDRDGIVTVVFQWSNEHGECYECGAPAAFHIDGPNPAMILASSKRCSVCAANAVTEDGESIHRIDPHALD